MGRGSNGVVDDSVSGWGAHSLFGSYRDKVELVDVFVGDLSVDNRARHWVLKSANITVKESSVHTFARVDVHELGVSEAQAVESLLDLVDFSSADTFDLALTNTVSVEDDLSWIGTVSFLESFAG